ncbi:unnamed protein product [Rotaria sp. Silwood1]|nr:unnamed protein product [Rotaria sp. Silwood1]CAF1627870.1 unnamed protein product [Rotaria sp. Silwood1]
MSSSEQFEEIEDDDKLQLLSDLINNPSTSDKKKAKCLHQRIIINYENKKWLSEMPIRCRSAKKSIKRLTK